MIGLMTLVEREIVRFYRQRSRVIGALLTPLLFWLMIGGGIGRSFQMGGAGATSGSVPHEMNFMEYFFPGILVLIVFFTAIFSTISVIEDRREGFLQGVLVAPVSRMTVAGGKIAGGALLAVGQGALFLMLAPFAHITLSLPGVLLTLLALTLVAVALTGLGFIIAWQMDSTQGFHAIMNVFLIPLWILSGAAFPASGAQAWLRPVMALNPVAYGVSAVRQALYVGVPGHPGTETTSLPVALAITAAFALVMTIISSVVVQRRTASHG